MWLFLLWGTQRRKFGFPAYLTSNLAQDLARGWGHRSDMLLSPGVTKLEVSPWINGKYSVFSEHDAQFGLIRKILYTYLRFHRFLHPLHQHLPRAVATRHLKHIWQECKDALRKFYSIIIIYLFNTPDGSKQSSTWAPPGRVRRISISRSAADSGDVGR